MSLTTNFVVKKNKIGVHLSMQSVNVQVSRLNPKLGLFVLHSTLSYFSMEGGRCHGLRKAVRRERWVNGQCQPNLENRPQTQR